VYVYALVVATLFPSSSADAMDVFDPHGNSLTRVVIGGNGMDVD